MGPATSLVFVIFMTLLNAGLLGLMHSALPVAMQPSAASWRIGSIVAAAGLILIALQNYFPAGIILPVGNFFVVLGLTGYWRSIRQFYGQTDRYWMLFPTFVATLSAWWFTVLSPSFAARTAWVSLSSAAVMLGCIWTLYAQGGRQSSTNRNTLIGMFGFMFTFMMVRISYFLFVESNEISLLDTHNWMNMLTPFMLAILPVTGTTAFLLLCSERIRRDWEVAASTDALTGLANRRTLALSAPILMAQAHKTGAGFALALIDIDHFKSINDRFGHDIGDAALKHVADVLKSACPVGAQLCRHGGEEFVALLSGQLSGAHCDLMQPNASNIDTAINQAKQANADAYERIFDANSKKLLNALREREFVASEVRIAITVSIGMAILGDKETNLDDLLRRADQALYAAKSSGRDRLVVAQ